MDKLKPIVWPVKLREEVAYYSLERLRLQPLSEYTWACLQKFSLSVSPAGQPWWWLRWLVGSRKQNPAIPRAYLHDINGLIYELQIHQHFRPKVVEWGKAWVWRPSQDSLASNFTFNLEGEPWGLACTWQGLTKHELLALLRVNGYRLPSSIKLAFEGARLQKLQGSVELWIGDLPLISVFSIAQFLAR